MDVARFCGAESVEPLFTFRTWMTATTLSKQWRSAEFGSQNIATRSSMSVYVHVYVRSTIRSTPNGSAAWWRQDANLEAYLSDQAEQLRDFLERKSEPTKGQVVLVDVFRVGVWSDCTGLARV